MSHLGIFESIDDPLFVANAKGQIVETNNAFSAVLGKANSPRTVIDVWPEIAEIWEPALTAADYGKQLRIDVNATSVDGRRLIFDVRIFTTESEQSDSSERLIVAVARDVTAERSNVNQLELKATTDSLTNAYNRGQLAVLLTQSISSAQRRKTTGCFLYIDIDKFKSINDNFGHDEGDRVLREISEYLQSNLRNSDVVGRLGGDEFGVILTDANQESGAVKANQIATALNSSITVGNSDDVTALKVSIGLAVFPNPEELAEDVIKRADTAMYRAKKLPGSHVEIS
jgi:diguanylate cyclase (GGDEF)-like protein